MSSCPSTRRGRRRTSTMSSWVVTAGGGQNLWSYPGASSVGSDARQGLRLHPTVKPTAMIEDALLDLTDRGEIVLDPFLGSGSTVMAAEKAGRTCRGVEIDPMYVDVVLRRFEAATGTKAVRLNV